MYICMYDLSREKQAKSKVHFQDWKVRSDWTMQASQVPTQHSCPILVLVVKEKTWKEVEISLLTAASSL